MSAILPPAGSFLSNAGDNVSRGPLFEDWRNRTSRLPGGTTHGIFTIVGGLATITTATALIDTEGSAATDNLDRISLTDWEQGSVVFIRARDPGREIVVRHGQGGAGQILLDSNASVFLDDSSMTLVLLRESDYWRQLGIWFGTQSGQARTKLGLSDGATMPVATFGEAVATGTPGNSRIITPLRLNDVLNYYPALFGRMATKGNAAVGGDEVILGTTDGSTDVVAKGAVGTVFPHLFTTHFYSGELTCAAGDTGSVPHNLGGRAVLIQATLLCKTAQHGYGAGDEISVDTIFASSETRGLVYGTTATNIFWRVRTVENLAILGFNGAYAVITPANWRLILRAWRAG